MNGKSFTLRDTSKGIVRTVIVDILSLFVVYYLPTISHHFIFPLYMLDPMRIVVFASVLLSGNRTNSYIFAITIPFFSYFVGGHPVLIKSSIIALELFANVALFWFFYKKGWNVFFVTILSIIFAKLIYYACKISLIELGCLQMDVFNTSFIFQLIVALMLSYTILLFRKQLPHL